MAWENGSEARWSVPLAPLRPTLSPFPKGQGLGVREMGLH